MGGRSATTCRFGEGLGHGGRVWSHVSPLLPSRLSEGVLWPCPGALPGWHLPLGHHLFGIPDDEEACQARGGLRVCQAAPEHHLPQLQLHGAAAAVRVAGVGHFVRSGGRQPLGDAAGAGQGHLHPHLAVCLQLPGVCRCPCHPQQPALPAQPHHHVAQLLAQGQASRAGSAGRAGAPSPVMSSNSAGHCPSPWTRHPFRREISYLILVCLLFIVMF